MQALGALPLWRRCMRHYALFLCDGDAEVLCFTRSPTVSLLTGLGLSWSVRNERWMARPGAPRKFLKHVLVQEILVSAAETWPRRRSKALSPALHFAWSPLPQPRPDSIQSFCITVSVLSTPSLASFSLLVQTGWQKHHKADNCSPQPFQLAVLWNSSHTSGFTVLSSG